MDLLARIPFYIYVVNMMAKAVSLSKHVIAMSVTSGPACFIHAQSDEPDISGESQRDNAAQSKNRMYVQITRQHQRNKGASGSHRAEISKMSSIVYITDQQKEVWIRWRSIHKKAQSRRRTTTRIELIF